MSVSREAHSEDVNAHEELFDKFYDRLPKEFGHERALLKYRVWRSPELWELAPETVVGGGTRMETAQRKTRPVSLTFRLRRAAAVSATDRHLQHIGGR